jgi:hypothetical protein
MSQSQFHQAPQQPQSGRSPLPTSFAPPMPRITNEFLRPRRKKLRLLLILICALIGSFVVYAAVRPERASVSSGLTNATTSNAPTRTIAPGETQTLSALDLRPGDCYNQEELPPTDGTTVPISSVELTSCKSSHNAQVIAKVPFKITDNYADVRQNEAGPACDHEFGGKVQANILADTSYQSVILSPADQASWTRGPVVACVLVTETPHTGSALIA